MEPRFTEKPFWVPRVLDIQPLKQGDGLEVEPFGPAWLALGGFHLTKPSEAIGPMAPVLENGAIVFGELFQKQDGTLEGLCCRGGTAHVVAQHAETSQTLGQLVAKARVLGILINDLLVDGDRLAQGLLLLFPLSHVVMCKAETDVGLAQGAFDLGVMGRLAAGFAQHLDGLYMEWLTRRVLPGLDQAQPDHVIASAQPMPIFGY